jgi:hypothetical protein
LIGLQQRLALLTGLAEEDAGRCVFPGNSNSCFAVCRTPLLSFSPTITTVPVNASRLRSHPEGAGGDGGIAHA